MPSYFFRREHHGGEIKDEYLFKVIVKNFAIISILIYQIIYKFYCNTLDEKERSISTTAQWQPRFTASFRIEIFSSLILLVSRLPTLESRSGFSSLSGTSIPYLSNKNVTLSEYFSSGKSITTLSMSQGISSYFLLSERQSKLKKLDSSV